MQVRLYTSSNKPVAREVNQCNPSHLLALIPYSLVHRSAPSWIPGSVDGKGRIDFGARLKLVVSGMLERKNQFPLIYGEM